MKSDDDDDALSGPSGEKMNEGKIKKNTMQRHSMAEPFTPARELGKQPLALDEHLKPPLLGNPPIFNDDHPVTHPHYLHLVCHHHRRPPDLGTSNGLEHRRLVRTVQRRRTFVENENPRRTCERARNLETLGLPARYERRVLTHEGIVPLRERHDEVVHVGCPRGAHDVVIGEFAEVSVRYVVPDGAVEEVWSLIHDRDVVAQVVDVRLSELVSADGYHPRGGLV